MAATSWSSAPSIAAPSPASCTEARAAAPVCFSSRCSTVEINNDIVALEQQEQEEVRRILLALSDAFRRRGDELQRTVEAATELDVLQARARFSILVEGVEPILAGDGRLELRAARHPLLIPAVRRHLGKRVADGRVPDDRTRSRSTSC